MTIKISGDLNAVLAKWQRKIVKAPQVLTLVSANLAEESIDLIKQGFEGSTDPYGKPWEALKLRSGRPLQKTGGLKASWYRKRADRAGFEIRSGKSYSVFHQSGTGIYGVRKREIVPKNKQALKIPTKSGNIFARSVKGVPKRKMIPDKRGLPGRWKKAYKDTAQEVLVGLFR